MPLISSPSSIGVHSTSTQRGVLAAPSNASLTTSRGWLTKRFNGRDPAVLTLVGNSRLIRTKSYPCFLSYSHWDEWFFKATTSPPPPKKKKNMSCFVVELNNLSKMFGVQELYCNQFSYYKYDWLLSSHHQKTRLKPLSYMYLYSLLDWLWFRVEHTHELTYITLDVTCQKKCLGTASG